jgi:methylglutaconyl-CoA hydratase
MADINILDIEKPQTEANGPQAHDIQAPHSGRIRILSLARPSSRNAISRQLLHELRQSIDSISSEYTSDGSEAPPKKLYGGAAGVDERGPTRVLILSSDVDSCFCAGADLKERAGFSADEYVLFPIPHLSELEGGKLS